MKAEVLYCWATSGSHVITYYTKNVTGYGKQMLLTEEECFSIIDGLDTTYQEDLAIIAKAQLKMMMESDVWEYCESAGDNFTGKGYFISEDDWQTLLEEIK